jgi:hypothetical protein
MTNEAIANKIYDSYFEATKINNPAEAKKHANALIDAQIVMMYQDEPTVIIDTDRELYAEDWEEIKYLVNTKND